MVVRFEESARNALLDAALDRANTGGAGTLRIYTGSQPPTANTAPTGTLLVTLTLNAPAFLSATGGVKTLNLSEVIQANAVASGNAGWARLSSGAGVTVMDGNVAVSGGDFTINTLQIISAQAVVLLGGTITDPA